ncbi:MAG: hypothetical protein VST64_05345 [Nitrospirota bacterium]|nr:hypothetical protein [Nitrospirota bacterium]
MDEVPDIHQLRLWVGSGYRQLQEVKFRFCPQSSYSVAVKI